MRVTNAFVFFLGQQGRTVFQSPICGSQTHIVEPGEPAGNDVSIPYMRVTNVYVEINSFKVIKVSIPYMRVTNGS